MTRLEIRQSVLDALGAIAPEARPEDIAPSRPLRDQLDIDSFDFLRLLVSLHERLGPEVPESDYGGLRTVDDLVAWFAARLGATD